MQTESDVPYFEPTTRPAELRIRFPAALRDDLKLIAEIWNALEERVGSGSSISLNDVIVRLLSVGRDGVFAEYGGKPETSAGQAALVERLARAYNKNNDKR